MEGASWGGHAGTGPRGIISKSRLRGTWGGSCAVADLSVIGGGYPYQERRGQKLLMRTGVSVGVKTVKYMFLHT